jgi:hypothetical protein
MWSYQRSAFDGEPEITTDHILNDFLADQYFQKADLPQNNSWFWSLTFNSHTKSSWRWSGDGNKNLKPKSFLFGLSADPVRNFQHNRNDHLQSDF